MGHPYQKHGYYIRVIKLYNSLYISSLLYAILGVFVMFGWITSQKNNQSKLLGHHHQKQ